jgi:hypothetical protein
LNAYKKSTFLVVSILVYLLFLPFKVLAADDKGVSASDYSDLAGLYKQYSHLEENLFKRLSFRLSKEQLVKDGSTFKLTLEDDQGGKWVFKEGGINRVIAHRIYALFGIASPEIHSARIILNGKPLKGTFQRYIFSSSTLSGYKAAVISAGGLDYLMKTQVLDWMMRDHDPNLLNFLVLSLDKDNRPDSLLRIDQDCACPDSEFSDLDYASMTAVRKDIKGKRQGNVYCLIRQACLEKEISPNLNQAYGFAKFVQGFPDALFEEIVWNARIPGPPDPGNDEFPRLRKKYSFFWDNLYARKRVIAEDFGRFYSDIDPSPGGNIQGFVNGEVRSCLESACRRLREQIVFLLEARKKIRSDFISGPVEINATASFEGFKIMQEFYRVYWNNGNSLGAECVKALEALKDLRRAAQPREQKAIDIYAREIKGVQQGKTADFSQNQVNRMIDPCL